MHFTESGVTAMLAKSREACKRVQKLGMLGKTVAPHRLKELRHLRAVGKLAARRSSGFDWCDVHDGKWIHSPPPPTPEQTTASMWADVNALKKKISTSEKERWRKRVENFLNELEQGIASLMEEEFARLERMITERRGRAAAHMVVAPIGTAQPSNPRSRCSEISFDVHACVEGNTDGSADPESEQLGPSSAGTDQLESPSAGMGFETPGQQCLSNWEMERIAVDGCLLVGMSSNLGGNMSSLEELVIVMQIDSQTASSKTVCKKMNRKPKDKEPVSEENKQFDPGGNKGKATSLKSGCTGISFF